ncbi:MAG: IS200/IS605 family transposase [Chlamydiales bacterium]|nr:IS200/IS605 family transposase [Chlamydiales bacterium]
MSHSYRIHFFHLIWSTRERRCWITSGLQSSLYSYIGGIVKKQNGHLIEVGGMSDHIHLLVEVSNLDKFSHLIRDVKASSSLWIHKQSHDLKDFAWQEGYGSFSVSFSGLEEVKKYIQNQKQHHSTMSFEEEYLKFLACHRVKYDDRFVLG